MPQEGLHHRAVSEIEGLLTPDSNRIQMRISIMITVLLLSVSSAFIGLTQAASCGGSCAIGTSYDFLGDPSINMDTVGGLNPHYRVFRSAPIHSKIKPAMHMPLRTAL